jgi:protease-4
MPAPALDAVDARVRSGYSDGSRMSTHASRRLVATALVASGLCACAFEFKPGPPEGDQLRVFTLDEAMSELPQTGPFGGSINHRALLDRISDVASAQDTTGLFVELGELHGAWARAADMRDALAQVRKVKKPVHCYFEVTDNLGYALLAESCDRISITPSGTLDLVGVSLETVYARELLQNLGLRAEMLQAGPFKGAADALTRDDMPDEVRQTLGKILDDLQARVVTSIARGRKLDPERVRALIDEGPFTSEDARKAGLVDDVAFDDVARTYAKNAAKATRVVHEELRVQHDGFAPLEFMRSLFTSDEEEGERGQRLVLAYLDGTITRGSPSNVRGAQAGGFVHAMRGFADDDNVRAVVLRVDSPGGSAMASDLMWQAVRKVAKHKPVIVSIGDMCASGGYYVASAGTEIMAQNESLVGSIGVVGGKVVAEDLAKRVGVHVEHLSRGKHAGWQSAARAFSPDERNMFEHQLKDTYARFVSRIGEGRKLTASQIEPYAEGRLMTAQRAREGHLVDSEGGLQQAIKRAAQRGGLGADVRVQVWPERRTFLQEIAELTSGAGGESSSLLKQLRAVERIGLIETLLEGDGMSAAVLPYVLSVH